MDIDPEIKSLKSEIEKKDAELQQVKERLRGLDDTVKATLYLLEDVNEAKAQVERAEKGFEEETELTKHLLMIAEATAHTTSIDKLMEQTVHCAREITGCDIVLSYLWDGAERVFKPSHETGVPHNLAAFFRTEPVHEEDLEDALLKGQEDGLTSGIANLLDARDVLLGMKPVILNLEFGMRNAESGVEESGIQNPKSKIENSQLFPWLADVNIKAMGIIILKGRKEALGFIAGIFLQPMEINVRLKKVMEGISNQVSVALEEARLYRESIDRAIELSNKIETIQAMHEIDRSILSTLDRDEILHIAARMVARVIPCDRATVALVDRQKGGFVYSAGFGIESMPLGAFVPFRDTSTTEAAETMRPQYERNLAEIRDLLPFEKTLLEKGFLSHIRVPLIVKEDAVGVLNVGSKRPSAFTAENLSTLEKMASQISVALENARLVSDLEELFLGTVKSLSSAIDAKSKWTAGHSERVTSYALGIGKELGLSEKELKDLELAGLLHDVGKIGTYESILDKPARLTDEELAVMRQHPVKGAEIIAPIKQLKGVIPAIRHHHEFYNGTGYPDGLKGEQIPFHARILAVADTYDAMKADRPYRTGRTMEFILEEFKRCSGTQFDPKAVEAFLKLPVDVK